MGDDSRIRGEKMKKENFEKRLKMILRRHEDYFYGLCESVQDKVNFWQNYRSPLSPSRIFFFPKKNRVIIYDQEGGLFGKLDKNGRRIGLTPSGALRQIAEWSDGEIWDHQAEEEEKAEAAEIEAAEIEEAEREWCADLARSVGIDPIEAGCYC